MSTKKNVLRYGYILRQPCVPLHNIATNVAKLLRLGKKTNKFLCFALDFSYFCSMKLSVVIPVYRVEATLDRCVESVLRQHVDGMEVILVDDGSPDNCPAMCDEWARKSPHVRVIHKTNGGLSDARNAGIDIAQGEYITFVDSDDWLSDNVYEALSHMMGDNDIVEYSIADRLTLADHSYTDMNEYWIGSQAYTHTYAWNKLYRRSLFDNVRYPVGRVFEDAFTLPQLLRYAKRIVTTSQGYYHYTDNPKGITATATGLHLRDLLEAHLTNGMPIDDCYYMHLVNIQIDVCRMTNAPVSLPARKVRTTKLKGKARAKAILLNIFGINALCKATSFIHHVSRMGR